MKTFVVLSSGFTNRNQDELVEELQDHVTYNTAAWMCPDKVIAHRLFSSPSFRNLPSFILIPVSNIKLEQIVHFFISRPCGDQPRKAEWATLVKQS